ncbi:MAG: hypothetical protein A3D24_00615 [Candidatus Blackburnbacteria bacterium RIFCSPHIGHO2_02_FULL_39_13]|uniref:Uncharacterized protein n=1 Tax=Candidatus Blackburnbacteria bacterium RIFCSPLOWO2_01_FULL_40_20 TaxID=1797519 RepID=A0A1G1VFV1_9BACT|nr:MAG: hypothetical protein UT38_C0003G0040 [Microgenomates group bacterium GW2011_GWA2_39_19]OGY07577.1 MAG: hypothetical protein A2694_04965 [Candidatus Blackburnbacteria bacterium RIFCSPHIGHO2_01_FULL_40_17]OGY08660.1 MAG: hypothetical protein A3D24_00615 [Candidatus Blackburnbacteria bacterium RIFCSPHIGHO2_02_FULL_39_13]OGY14294.1 MAG: hypothetical protein A3A77_02360 [Candidatus Blackburnbacteria bacterium RIFCSPLOWO2_01_FULL_40_20]OGY14619.1 MAG: hypothetical protein A3I52_00565 [Candida
MLNNIQTRTNELATFNFSSGSIGDIISAIIPILFFIAGFILLLMIVLGGFGYMTSMGDPKAAESAKAKITHALTGFIIIFIAYWLVQILGMIFGIAQFGRIF